MTDTQLETYASRVKSRLGKREYAKLTSTEHMALVVEGEYKGCTYLECETDGSPVYGFRQRTYSKFETLTGTELQSFKLHGVTHDPQGNVPVALSDLGHICGIHQGAVMAFANLFYRVADSSLKVFAAPPGFHVEGVCYQPSTMYFQNNSGAQLFPQQSHQEVELEGWARHLQKEAGAGALHIAGFAAKEYRVDGC